MGQTQGSASWVAAGGASTRSHAVARNSTKSGVCTRSIGAAAERLRRDDRAQPDLLHAVADQEGAARHLEARHQLAVDQLELAVLQGVILGVHGEHERWRLRRGEYRTAPPILVSARDPPYRAKESVMRNKDFSFRADE